MNLQQHLEIQASAQQWADDFMQNYDVTATEMIDALTKVLINLKDKSIVEYLTEIANKQQEYAAAQQEQMQSQTPQEEEVDGREPNTD